MGKDKKTPITINDKEYVIEDMTDEQKTLVNHSVDLSRKIDSMKFNLDQLNVGKDTFVRLLEESLNKQDSDVEEAEVIN
jgi:hypothetical protein|tara:strand:- start:393 stop:629 length:237 start_codon:yes stop_codon:yes gene_type:complete